MPGLVLVVSRTQSRHLGPFRLGQLAVARQTGFAQHLGVEFDGGRERIPLAVQFVLEQPLGQLHRIGERGPAGIQVQFDDVGQQATQFSVGVVAFLHDRLHPRHGVFRQIDHGRRSAIGDPAIQRVDHIPNAGDKGEHLAIFHKAARGGRALECLLPGLDGCVDITPPTGRQQQLFPHPVVAQTGAHDQVD